VPYALDPPPLANSSEFLAGSFWRVDAALRRARYLLYTLYLCYIYDFTESVLIYINIYIYKYIYIYIYDFTESVLIYTLLLFYFTSVAPRQVLTLLYFTLLYFTLPTLLRLGIKQRQKERSVKVNKWTRVRA
jgi:hypothetical protein